MSFRRSLNKHDIWLKYCAEHADTLDSIGLESAVFQTENAFREYATHGTVDGESKGLTSIANLSDDRFWLLFEFADDYFGMDTIGFDVFEASRTSRKAPE
jgi:hypothetical protein